MEIELAVITQRRMKKANPRAKEPKVQKMKSGFSVVIVRVSAAIPARR